jgi:hypothetical protein
MKYLIMQNSYQVTFFPLKYKTTPLKYKTNNSIKIQKKKCDKRKPKI